MKIILGLFFSLCFIIPTQVKSLEKGVWTFVKTDEYCYIGSLATDSDLSSEKNRGENYILVYKNIGSPETIVQIEKASNGSIFYKGTDITKLSKSKSMYFSFILY